MQYQIQDTAGNRTNCTAKEYEAALPADPPVRIHCVAVGPLAANDSLWDEPVPAPVRYWRMPCMASTEAQTCA